MPALAGWMHVGVAQEQMSGQTSEPSHQGGWVIELDHEGQAQTEAPAGPEAAPQTTQPAPRSHGGTGVEMIVGGQGSGGVAKKGTLPVID